jgi:hypothetical protein
MLELKPWTLPPIVAAILIPITVGFLLAGPLLGLFVGFLVTAAIVVIAVRQKPSEPIRAAPAADAHRHVLVVIGHELDDPRAIDAVKQAGHLADDGEPAEVRVLAPAEMKLADRWATDVGPAREEAQRKLVVSIASLEKADVPADATVGDEGIVQAIEDELRSFPARDVVLVTGPPEADPKGAAAARELEHRLEGAFHRIVSDDSQG